jgi:glucosamine 6-phosphate synthetase-like amidotransferase/phosphosugar isomerase protein
MCSIVGSYSKDMFIELLKLNRYRGAFSHSLTLFQKDRCVIFKDFGDFNLDLLNNVIDGDYMLGHCQSPTNGLVKEFDRIHPFVDSQFKLLHNGIIKKQEVDRLNLELGSSFVWDTQLLGTYIKEDFDKLSDIEGSFACACIKDNELYIFRNAISPLYLDNAANISSTKFNDAIMIENNNIYKMIDNTYVSVDKFNNTHNPYYF